MSIKTFNSLRELKSETTITAFQDQDGQAGYWDPNHGNGYFVIDGAYPLWNEAPCLAYPLTEIPRTTPQDGDTITNYQQLYACDTSFIALTADGVYTYVDTSSPYGSTVLGFFYIEVYPLIDPDCFPLTVLHVQQDGENWD